MKYKILIMAILLSGWNLVVQAQQKMNMSDSSMKHMHMDTTRKEKAKKPVKMDHAKMGAGTRHDSTAMKGMHMDHAMDGMDMSSMDMNGMPMMSNSQSRNLPMNRSGSGTSWLPDASPMYGIMLKGGKWNYMLHGNIDVRYTKQDLFDKGSHGGDKFDAPNWFMGMAQRQVGKNGLLHLNLMMSLDPITEGGGGYPLLFQSGESWKGSPLIDHQHPHDLFSELSASYSYAFSRRTDLSVYVGYPGEPALGPVAFMHRPSAMGNPDAPISHHWSDATHITFGVATIGFRFDQFKIEASSFTGREPNENRYNFDKPKFDSWSTRLNYNPSANWALQVSHGFIKSPEELNPEENVYRTTASAVYSLPFGDERTFNATALWGLNKSPDQQGDNSALLEADVRIKKLELYTRYEFVQKTTEELVLNPLTYGNDTIFPVNGITLGINYDDMRLGPVNLAAGGQLTYYGADQRLNSLYGSNPMAGQVFLRLYPRLMKMKM
ncbi:hypothetical protein [Mucilaginibacter lacusdianchii]|uniref:hypothetical protein n=1 Tax=Mucilaginibacter lacusdianchii TaxID=2684211 RepID=UPI00131EC2F0|nr:hypothetical protein [Mucilaginibacter sp. JXJ CY 39]